MKRTFWFITLTLFILIASIAVLCYLTILFIDDSRYQSHEDDFYNDTGAYPSSRIPLIKPYDLYSKEGEPWGLSLHESLWSPDSIFLYNGVRDVRKLSIKDGVIMVYSPHVNEKIEQSMRASFFHWFVVIPDKNIEMGFNNEKVFLEYIEQFHIQKPNWCTPDDIFDEYIETECLEWIPDCKQ